MAKLVLNDVNMELSPSAVTEALNANWAALEAFAETVLSRDGTNPNQMQANLDMNGKEILNHISELGDGAVRKVSDSVPAHDQTVVKDLKFVGATVGPGGLQTALITIDTQPASDMPFVPPGTPGALPTATFVEAALNELGFHLVEAQSDITALETKTSQKFIKGAVWTGGTSAIIAPTNDVIIEIPANCHIEAVQVLTTEANGSCVIDVKVGNYGTFPTSASICASALPTIVTNNKYRDTVLTGWTRNLTAGQFLVFNLISSSTFKYIAITLELTLT